MQLQLYNKSRVLNAFSLICSICRLSISSSSQSFISCCVSPVQSCPPYLFKIPSTYSCISTSNHLSVRESLHFFTVSGEILWISFSSTSISSNTLTITYSWCFLSSITLHISCNTTSNAFSAEVNSSTISYFSFHFHANTPSVFFALLTLSKYSSIPWKIKANDLFRYISWKNTGTTSKIISPVIFRIPFSAFDRCHK